MPNAQLALSMPLLIALISSSSLAFATDAATYQQNLGKVYQGMREAQNERDVCNSLYPETATANNHAWKAWQSSNKSLVDEYNRRYDDFLHQLAGKKKEKYRQYKVIQEGKYAEAAVTRKVAIQQAGPQQGKAICQNYPTALNSTLDPAHRFSREIADNRRLQPKA